MSAEASRVLEWVELPHGGEPGAACPFPGDSSVWFRIVQNGKPLAWNESESHTAGPFLDDLEDWWGGDAREIQESPYNAFREPLRNFVLWPL